MSSLPRRSPHCHPPFCHLEDPVEAPRKTVPQSSPARRRSWSSWWRNACSSWWLLSSWWSPSPSSSASPLTLSRQQRHQHPHHPGRHLAQGTAPAPPLPCFWRDLKRNLLKLVVNNAELSVGGAAAADLHWLAHHPRLPLPQRWQAHQAGLSHHTGQLFLEIIQNQMQCGENIPPQAQRGTPKSSSSFLAAVDYCPLDHFIVILTVQLWRNNSCVERWPN